MRRVRELISLVQQAYPHDGFFENIESTWAASAQARAQYAAYNHAFCTMDEVSWGEMKRKALAHYLDHRPGQLKQGFFNQLNEAFAYRHLVRRGYSGVRVLREDGKTKPDLEYVADEGRSFCEVKTVGISQEQLARWDAAQAFSSSVYAELSEGFMKKLKTTVSAAWKQITKQDASGLVYLIVFFDDFTLTYYDRYRTQIAECLNLHEAPFIHIQVGLLGRRRIEKLATCG